MLHETVISLEEKTNPIVPIYQSDPNSHSLMGKYTHTQL